LQILINVQVTVRSNIAVRQSAIGYNQLVDESTVEKLNALNRQFYQTLGEQFSATRRRIHPGVRRLLPSILNSANILDLGCGNGELARQLSQQDFLGSYTGLDISLSLLKEASEVHPLVGCYCFLQADLSNPEWAQVLYKSGIPEPFDCILAFASLHHLPGKHLRTRILCQARQLISPKGLLIHSEWMFLNSARLREHILPWETAGLIAAQVDPGDYLLDWRGGDYGLRYVHHFTSPELEALAAETGFRVQQSFLSDGEGSKLSHYQVWLPAG